MKKKTKYIKIKKAKYTQKSPFRYVKLTTPPNAKTVFDKVK